MSSKNKTQFNATVEIGVFATRPLPANVRPGSYFYATDTGLYLCVADPATAVRRWDQIGSSGGGGSSSAVARAASTGTIANLSSCPVSQDGVTLVQGDTFLVKDSASPDGIVPASHAYDGPYTVGVVGGGNAPLTRLAGFDTSSGLAAGASVYVKAGTLGAEKLWRQTTATAIVVNTTALNWYPFEEAVHTVDFNTGTPQYNFVFGGPASFFSGSGISYLTTGGFAVQAQGLAGANIVLQTLGNSQSIFLDGGDNTDSIGIGTQTDIAAISISRPTGPAVLLGNCLELHSTDSTGAPGNATINKASGRSSIALGQTTMRITNSLAKTGDIVLITPLDIDANVTKWKAEVTADTHIDVTVNTATAANFRFQWMLIKQTT